MVGGEMVPQRLPGMTGGQAQPDAIGLLPDPAADLEQTEPQGVKVHPRDLLVLQPAAHRVEQPVAAAWSKSQFPRQCGQSGSVWATTQTRTRSNAMSESLPRR